MAMTSRSRGSNQFLAAAERYAARGWPVFPLIPRDKAPLKGTRGFLDASTDRTQVLQWWQLFPDANIGLSTGVGFDVLDIDGPKSVPALQELLGMDYRHTGPVVRTGKGTHLYFQPLQSGRNRAGLFGGHCDYRGAGGYVVAPPSVHPSGRVYDWDAERDDSRPLPLVPEVLQAVILKPEARVAQKRVVIQNGDEIIAMDSAARRQLGRRDILLVVESLGGTVVSHGALYATNCFFHHDPGPSMVLYISDNSFHCYGCEAHGDSEDLAHHRDMTGRKFL